MREYLPPRRRAETFRFQHEGADYTATLGYYDDGRLGEVFIQGRKIDTPVDIYARDTAIIASLALQHGCSVENLRRAVIRDAAGGPGSPIGTLLDLLEERK